MTMHKHTELLIGASAIATIVSTFYLFFMSKNSQTSNATTETDQSGLNGYDQSYQDLAYNELANIGGAIGSVSGDTGTAPAGVSVPSITLPSIQTSNSTSTSSTTANSSAALTAAQTTNKANANNLANNSTDPNAPLNSPDITNTGEAEVVSDFQLLFGRNPAQSGLNFWSAAAGNLSPEQLMTQIAGDAAIPDQQALASIDPTLSSALQANFNATNPSSNSGTAQTVNAPVTDTTSLSTAPKIRQVIKSLT